MRGRVRHKEGLSGTRLSGRPVPEKDDPGARSIHQEDPSEGRFSYVPVVGRNPSRVSFFTVNGTVWLNSLECSFPEYSLDTVYGSFSARRPESFLSLRSRED